MPTQGSCEKACAEKLAACQAQAQKDFNTMRQQCLAYPDANDQAACLTSASRAFQANLEACQADYQVCLQVCRGGYYT